jgi:ABC-type glycerol-3-phosphate transport system substrate-binding protein
MTGLTRWSRRRLATVTLAAVSGALGAACAVPRQAADTKSPEALAPAALSFWPIARGPDAERVFGRLLVPEFRERHPQVTVEVTPAATPGELLPKVLTAAAAGTLPDIAVSGGGNVHQMARLGIPAALDERVRRWGTGVRDDFYPAALRLSTFEGRLLGLPLRLSTPAYYWRQDLLREAGVPRPPDTWEAVLDATRRLTKLDAESATVVRPGFAHTNASQLRFEFLTLLRSLDTPLVRGGRATFNGPEGLVAAQLLADRGAIFPAGTPLPRFAGNDLGLAQVGGVWANLSTVRTVKTQTPEQYGQVVMGPPPVPGGQRYRPPDARRVRPAAFVNTEWYFLTAASRHPDQAWAFLTHVLSPEALVTYNEAEFNLVSRKSAAQLGFMLEEKVQTLAAQVARHGQSMYKLVDGSLMNPSIEAALVAIAQGTAPPRQALDAAAREWDQIMREVGFTGDSD